MAVDSYLRTYDDSASRKESVLDEIELLSALEDGVMTAIGKSRALNTVHSVLTDSITTSGSLAASEAADVTMSALGVPSRVTNITEIIQRPFAVSDTQQAVEHYGFADQYAYAMSKAMKEWTQNAECDLVRSTLVSGASGTAPKMSGIVAGITTNATTHASGTVFSETIMNGLFQLAWGNSNGEVATDIYVGATIKRRISSFAGRSGSTALVNNSDVQNAVDMYMSDFGNHRVHLHRYVTLGATTFGYSADSTGRFLAIRPEKWSIAWLREPKHVPLAKLGSSERGMVEGEFTLENKNERCSVYSNGFLLTV